MTARPEGSVLTEREKEAISLIAAGHKPHEAAKIMSISEASLQKYLQSATTKLRAQS